MSRATPPRMLVIGCVMVCMSMVALEMTIVSTAMPQIAAQLGDIQLYSWVFSAFVLTQTAMTVVFGKLADVYGRKPVMLIGLGIFMLGSVLAGFAWSMPAMIGARLVQGVGAGAVLPSALTIVSDLYPANERGKVQGYLASVWAVSSVIGPIVGGLIIRQFSWAWIFWINVPIGLAAAIGFIVFLRSDVARSHPKVDYFGAGLFTVTIASLMIALTDTAEASTRRLLICAAVFCAGLVLFVWQERRAADPMISFKLWRRRPIAAANGAAVVSGMVLIGLTTFLPMYVQGVLHRTPVIAGLTLTVVMLGWPMGATLASRIFQRVGLRLLMVVGAMLLPVGASVFLTLTPDSSPVLAGAGSLVMGLGMGLISVSSLLLIQQLVVREERASATASNLFSRNLGSTLGAAILGAVQTFGLGAASHMAGAIPGDGALQHSLHLTFFALFAISLFCVVFMGMVPSLAAPKQVEVAA